MREFTPCLPSPLSCCIWFISVLWYLICCSPPSALHCIVVIYRLREWEKKHMAHVQGDQLIKRSVVQGCVSVDFSAELMAVLTESDVDRDARRLYVDRGWLEEITLDRRGSFTGQVTTHIYNCSLDYERKPGCLERNHLHTKNGQKCSTNKQRENFAVRFLKFLILIFFLWKISFC